MLLLGSANVMPVDISVNLNFETIISIHMSEDVACVMSFTAGVSCLLNGRCFGICTNDDPLL